MVEDSYFGVLGIGLGCQARGDIRLKSADPAQQPLINFNLGDHPFDRRLLIETLRVICQVHKTKAINKFFKGHLIGPEGESDEQLWVYVLI